MIVPIEAIFYPILDTLAYPSNRRLAYPPQDTTADHRLPIGVVVMRRRIMLRMVSAGIR